MADLQKIKQTRDLIKYALKYVRGRTLDLGAGRAKYKDIITQVSKEYIASDKFSDDNIDVVCDIENTLFKDDYFDTIVCTEVLEHLPNPRGAVKEMQRILKSGGTAIIAVPFMTPFHEDPKDYFRYTTSGLETIFSSNDFATIEKGYYGKRFTVIAQFAEFIYFNPYREKKGVFSRRFMKLIYLLANFLDRFVKDEIVYAQCYIIAKKNNKINKR